VQGFFLVVQIGSPYPLTSKEVLPPLCPRGETHSPLGGEGVGEPKSDEGTDTLVLDNLSKVLAHPTYLVSWEGGSAVLYEFCLTAAPVLFIPLLLRLLK
jgi:hypothetical protein